MMLLLGCIDAAHVAEEVPASFSGSMGCVWDSFEEVFKTEGKPANSQVDRPVT
jgi:hypothetical protein